MSSYCRCWFDYSAGTLNHIFLLLLVTDFIFLLPHLVFKQNPLISFLALKK